MVEDRIDTGVVTTGAADIISVIVTDMVLLGLSASATEIVTLYEPFAPEAGVPEMTPVLLRFNPAGSVPDWIDHVYGLVPPVAPRLKV